MKLFLRFLGYACLLGAFAAIALEGFTTATFVVLFFGLVFLLTGW